MKRIYWILTSISLCSLTSYNDSTRDAKGCQAVKIDTAIFASRRSYLQYPGEVKAAQGTSLASGVSGTIQKIYVKDGARVQIEQLLAELDPTDYQVQLDAIEAEYKQIKAEAGRVMALYKDNGTTPSANDKIVYGLKRITARYQHHKDQLGCTQFYAPFSGYIQKRLLEAHGTIGTGVPVLSVISSGALKVEMSLPAAEYTHREQFGQYYYIFDIYPEQTYLSRLIGATPRVNASQPYIMYLQLPAGKQFIPSPGMNTMVTICCNSSNPRNLSIPGNTILQKNGRACIFVYDPPDNKVSDREVTIVRLTSDGCSIITSDGLRPGGLIASAGIHYIKNGEIVKPLPVTSETGIGGLL